MHALHREYAEIERFPDASDSFNAQGIRRRKRQRQSMSQPHRSRRQQLCLFHLALLALTASDCLIVQTTAFLLPFSHSISNLSPPVHSSSPGSQFTPNNRFQSNPSSTSSSSSALHMVDTLATRGLSRYFQAILSRTKDRQRFVTGQYPVIVSVEENPTQKWLNKDSATSLLLVNDTTIDRSLASYDRFQWLEDTERAALHSNYASLSMELLAEIHLPKPGYVHVQSSVGAGASAETLRELGSTVNQLWTNRWKNSSLYQELILDDLLSQGQQGQNPWKYTFPTQDRLWVTGFSLAGRKGIIKSVDVHDGHIESVNTRSESMTLWPNEVNTIPKDLIPSRRTQAQQKFLVGAHSNEKHYEAEQHSADAQSHHIAPVAPASTGTTVAHTSSSPTMPKETASFEDALLVSDGFLVPGKDRGGIYVIQNPGNPSSEWTISLTDREGDSWFYHRAVWVDLTGDGRKSILTARAKLRKVAGAKGSSGTGSGPSWLKGDGVTGVPDETTRPRNGQLVWLEMPEPHHYDQATGTPLEADGTTFNPFDAKHLPWKERVLAQGPDVMFSVADLDTTDDTIEVISSQFFDKKVTLHSIQRGPRPRITFTKVIDDRCGAAFGGILADLEGQTITQATPTRRVLDSGSTVPSVQPGDSFSHVLVTSHECNYAEQASDDWTSTLGLAERGGSLKDSTSIGISPGSASSQQIPIDGGSLFSYRVPKGKDGWKTEQWQRTTIATGFKVKGQLWNVINPGAPGFVYTFHAKAGDTQTKKRPMIAVAGDCAESAYIFRPEKETSNVSFFPSPPHVDPAARYKLMCEIKCGATVGSIGVGYDNLCAVEQESGYAKLYIPCYEKDKILVFAMGSGEGDEDDGGWSHPKSKVV